MHRIIATGAAVVFMTMAQTSFARPASTPVSTSAQPDRTVTVGRMDACTDLNSLDKVLAMKKAGHADAHDMFGDCFSLPDKTEVVILDNYGLPKSHLMLKTGAKWLEVWGTGNDGFLTYKAQ